MFPSANIITKLYSWKHIQTQNCKLFIYPTCTFPKHYVHEIKPDKTGAKAKHSNHNIQAKSQKFTIHWTVACRYKTPKRSCTATATWFGAYLMNSYKTKSCQESIYRQHFPVADIQTNSSSKCYAYSCSAVTAATMLCYGSQCWQTQTSIRTL